MILLVPINTNENVDTTYFYWMGDNPIHNSMPIVVSPKFHRLRHISRRGDIYGEEILIPRVGFL